MSVAEKVDTTKNTVLLKKYYIRKAEYDSFQTFISNGPGGDATVPRMQCCKERVNFKHFKKIFDLDIENLTKEDSPLILNRINEELRKIVLTRDDTKFILINKEEEFDTFKKAMDKAFDEGLTNLPEESVADGDNAYLRLYNVGQANCSAIYGENGLRAVFDLGSKNRKNREPISMLKNDTVIKTKDEKTGRITRIIGKPIIFVISHFHEDHVNLCANIPAKGFDNATFVFPFIDSNLSANLNVDAQYLILSAFLGGGRVIILKQSSPEPVIIGGIELYKGEKCVGGNVSERMNAEGVISYVPFGSNKILIPGDSLYFYWPKTFDVTHLIVPHHGCKLDKEKDPFIHIDSSQVKEAFVNSKFNKKYHHPNTTHTGHFNRVKMFYFKPVDGYSLYNGDEPISKENVPNISYASGSDYRDWFKQ